MQLDAKDRMFREFGDRFKNDPLAGWQIRFEIRKLFFEKTW
jgi:hypothetical protein